MHIQTTESRKTISKHKEIHISYTYVAVLMYQDDECGCSITLNTYRKKPAVRVNCCYDNLTFVYIIKSQNVTSKTVYANRVIFFR